MLLNKIQSSITRELRFIFRALRLNTADTDGTTAWRALVLRWNPFRRRQARFPSDVIEVNPFTSNAAADPNIPLSQVHPIPADEFLRCKRLGAHAPVLVDGISMQVVEHVPAHERHFDTKMQ
jgi:hypothetical protein